MDKIQLNLGCGAVRPQGWINTDSSLNAHMQRLPVLGKLLSIMLRTVQYDSGNVQYMNLNHSWNYASSSVDIVYASHLYEHLTLDSADLFLRESQRVLKPGGVIRVVVPDLYKICRKYVSEYESGNPEASVFLMWAINLHREGQYGRRIGWLKKMILEWQGYPHQHKFMYDEFSLRTKFQEFGFRDILSLSYGESSHMPEQIRDVEGSKESYLSVYLEARK
jgi:ubiquinone/menaquinone biosynthesis C-methylase UbiE